jgi:hypothetical protein
MKPTQANLSKRLEELEAQAQRAGLERAAADMTDEELLAIIEQGRAKNRAWHRARFPQLDDPEFADAEEFEAIREIEARPVTVAQIEALRAMMKRSAAAGIV